MMLKYLGKIAVFAATLYFAVFFGLKFFPIAWYDISHFIDVLIGEAVLMEIPKNYGVAFFIINIFSIFLYGIFEKDEDLTEDDVL